MFAMKSGTEVSINISLVAVVLFNALVPNTSVLASSGQEAEEVPTQTIAPTLHQGETQFTDDTTSSQQPAILFVENSGQFDARALFQAKIEQGTVYFAEDAIWLTTLDTVEGNNAQTSLDSQQPFAPSTSTEENSVTGVHIRLTFVDSNSNARVEGFNPQNAKVSFFSGNDEEEWQTNVPVWGGVRYIDFYPGYNLEITSVGSQWTWRLVQQEINFSSQRSGVNERIRLQVDGADSIALDKNTLIITTAVGETSLPLPTQGKAFSTLTTGSLGEPQLDGNEIILPLDMTSEIQPVSQEFADRPKLSNLSSTPLTNISSPANDQPKYSTYLGGSFDEIIHDLVIDDAGAVYVTGLTTSLDFPTTPGAFSAPGSGSDIIVSKLGINGNQLEWSAQIGGNAIDAGLGIALDDTNHIYLTGYTLSPDLPITPGAYDTVNSGTEAFVIKLNPSGTSLDYSTYLGTDGTQGFDIVVGSNGEAYITGQTASPSFPVTSGAFDETYNGNWDGFVSQLDSTGSNLIFSTFLGGSDLDCEIGGLLQECSIALDSSGAVYISGQTLSTDFPTTNGAFNETHNGDYDLFVTKLQANGSVPIYSTFIGGDGSDSCESECALTVDANGFAYISGATLSTNFPTTSGAYDQTHNGGWDTVVVKVASDGGSLVYSTYLGGSGKDTGLGIALLNGRAVITGETASMNFPVSVDPLQGAYRGGLRDAYITILNSDGSAIDYSTYLGGSANERGRGISAVGEVIAVAGNTTSSDFPLTAGAYDQNLSGVTDGYIFTFTPAIATVEITPSPLTADGNSLATVTLTVNNQDGLPIPNKPVEIGIVSGASLYINNQLANPNEFLAIGTTNASGVITTTLKTFQSGTRTITARINGQILISGGGVVEFLPGPVSANLSDLSVSSSSAPADGQTPITITITALDAYNNPIPNASIMLQTTGNAVLTQPSQPTNSQGKAIGQVRDSVSEAVTISATVNGVLLQNQANLTFTGPDIALSTSAAPEAMADTSLGYNITVQNVGGILMQNVSLQVQLPENLTFTSHTAPVEPTQNGQNLSWDLGAFSPNQKISFVVNGHINASANLDSLLTMNANVTSSTLDENPANNASTVSTTIVDGHNFTASITPSGSVFGVGAAALYQINIKNTGLIADQFDVSLNGLDPSWYALSNASIFLSPGETSIVPLEIQIDSCTETGNHPFQVTVINIADQQTTVLSASVTYQSGPILSEFMPGANALLGSQDVTVSWRSDAPSSSVLTIFPAGQPQNSTTYNVSSNDYSSVIVPDLNRNAAYDWLVEAVSSCGTTTSSQRQFTVGNGIVFINRNQNITINRDYDQRVSIGVRNDDNVSHTLTTSILDPYEDILVNFVDGGSQDQTISLQPGETRQVTLAIHAQDAQLDTYDLSALLVADEGGTPISDNMNLHLTVLKDANFTIVEDVAAFNPITLGRTYTITNYGRPVTDLSLKAIDPNTGLPAKIFLQPSLDHARIETGQSIRVVAYPIYTAEDAVAQANLLASLGAPTAGSSFDSANQAGSHSSQSENDSLLLVTYPIIGGLTGQASTLGTPASQIAGVGDIDFELQASGAGTTVSTGPVTTSCGTTRQIIPVTMQDCTMTFKTDDWYCTNRPLIDTSMPIPAFLRTENIASVLLKMTFQPQGNVLNHSSQINFNDTLIGSFTDTIPSGQKTFRVSRKITFPIRSMLAK